MMADDDVGTKRSTLIIELSVVPINMIILGLYTYNAHKEIKRCKEASHSINRYAIYVTFIMILMGFIYSFCVGIIENWLVYDCTAPLLSYITLFFYAAHRVLVFYIILYQLINVFAESAYSYPSKLYPTIIIISVLYFLSSYIVSCIEVRSTPIDTKWPDYGNGGSFICSWKFGIGSIIIWGSFESLMLVLLCSVLYKFYLKKRAIVGSDNTEMNLRFDASFRRLIILATIPIGLALFGLINGLFVLKPAFLDTIINTICIFLTFRFNHKYINIIFGMNCDRILCIQIFNRSSETNKSEMKEATEKTICISE